MKQTIRIADRSGDRVLEFDVDIEEQRARAQQQFEELINSGHQAFGFRANGQGELFTDKAYDPTLPRYVIMPRAVGG